MNENVKIKINEYDKTSPSGSGIDSTDIAFIPGFSILSDAPKNEPTLVTDIYQFERLFGDRPLVLTAKDITKEYEAYGFNEGDYDRSYVYAKELLLQGMPVLYTNLSDSSWYVSGNFAEFNASENDSTNTDYTVEVVDESSEGGKNFVKITAGSSMVNQKVTFVIHTKCNGIHNDESTFFDVSLAADNGVIKNVSIYDEDKDFKAAMTKNSGVIWSDTQVSLKSLFSDGFDIPLKVTLTLTLDKDDCVKIYLQEHTGCRLDAFYSNSKDTTNIIDLFSSSTDNTNSIADKSVYSVKYITSGGYPSVVKSGGKAKDVFATSMLSAAAHRGDAIALIDYQLDNTQTVFNTDSSSGSVYAMLHAAFNGKVNTEYGAAMYPWGNYNCINTLRSEGSSIISMPPSFGYMMCVAKAIKSSPNWLAMAGVSRGVVPGLTSLLVPNGVISNTIAEDMQPKFGKENHMISINTITNIRPYGLTLWGNRTLKPVSKDGTVALNFLNTRNMLSDIKKLLYTTAKSCMFEQNSTDLWIKFKNGIEPLLRRLKAGNGISDYQIVRSTTKYNGDPLTKGEIAAVIKVYPMYAVEYFELAVEINDEEVTVN